MSSADYQCDRKTKPYTARHKLTALCSSTISHCQRFFFPCLFLTFNTLISHVRTNPHLKLEKFSSGAAAEIGAEWQQLIELMVWVSEGLQAFSRKPPMGFPWFRNALGLCWLQLTGPPSGPSGCQDEENAPRRHTLTGVDVVVRVRHSFHFPHYATDPLAGWH